MANAIVMQINNTDVDSDGTIQIEYSGFVRDVAQGIHGGLPVTIRITPSMTPQQFRSELTNQTIEIAKSHYPTVTLNPSDCLIDVMQRGN